MPSDIALAGIAFAAVCLYFLFGGADFGGGVWDLLASGPRAAAQRLTIEHAIGPIWEVNHIWLIFVVVILFGGFPPAFAAISVALHVPLTLFLVGVVLRGAAFAFRGLGARGSAGERRWGLVFSVASTVSPLLLGMMVGALVSGRIRVAPGPDGLGLVTSGFFAPWLTPFSFAVGAFALALCAFQAATYLTVELDGQHDQDEPDGGTGDPELREDFRSRALGAGLAVTLCALVAFILAGHGAPCVRAALATRLWSWPFHILTGIAAVVALIALSGRQYRLARLAVGAQTVLILFGWAASQYPFLIVPDVTLMAAAARPETRHLLLVATAAGAVVLGPSLVVLFRVFKAAHRA
jgi:cytochrome d ubiquinol oxidase subunit II